MIGYLKRLTIRNLVSPYGLAIISYFLFLFAWIFPPGLYTSYIREPDLMFLDPVTFLFYTACLMAFLVGVRASRYLGASGARNSERHVSARSPLLYLLLPLLAATGAGAIYLMKVGARINFIALLATAQGSVLKAANGSGQMSEGRWDESIPLLTVVLWWSLFRATQLRLKGAVKAVFYLTFLPCLAVAIFLGVATVNRANLMPVILGTLVVYIFPKTRSANTRVVRLAFMGAVGSAAAVATFLFLSFLRGALGVSLLITSLLGYTVVSYNRMAALLAGVMHYAYEGHGVYLVPALLSDEKMNFVFQLADRFGWPSSFDLFQTEFLSTTAAGLNPAYIWAGAFGYVYSDLGWFTPFYWCLVGVLAGWLWSKFRACRTVGLVLYPWISFSILMWCGGNFIFRTNFIQYCEFAVVLHIYDKVFLHRTQWTEGIAHKPVAAFLEPATSLDRGLF
jgi:hypothetical protein